MALDLGARQRATSMYVFNAHKGKSYSAQNWIEQCKVAEQKEYMEYLKNITTYAQGVMPFDCVQLEKTMLGLINEEVHVMNKVIAEMYETTKDAVLVDKYFGNEICQNFSGKMLLSDHKEAYLVEAKRREEEAKLKK